MRIYRLICVGNKVYNFDHKSFMFGFQFRDCNYTVYIKMFDPAQFI